MHILERGLGSVGKVRILGILASDRVGLTRYALEQRSGLRYNHLIKALRSLLEIGWVEEIPIKPKKYKINEDNEVVRHLVEFFLRVGYI